MTPLAEALDQAEQTLADYRAAGIAHAATPAAIWPARLARALETLATAAEFTAAAAIAALFVLAVRWALRIPGRSYVTPRERNPRD